MDTLIAHTGHTLLTISYFLPVIAFVVWLAVVQVRDRRSGRDRDPEV